MSSSLSLSPLLRTVAALVAAVSLFATLPSPALAQPATDAPAPAVEAPAPAAPMPPPPLPEVTTEVIDNPYGLQALWAQGDLVARITLIILVIMSMGSWYVIFVKLFEQRKP
jgi:biopolymer transport protein ExbB